MNTAIANILSGYIGKGIMVDGDDLMVQDEFVGNDEKVRKAGKVSVSITYSKDNVSLGHTGINVTAGRRAPTHAFSTNLTDDEVESFMKDVIDMFYALNDDIFIAGQSMTTDYDSTFADHDMRKVVGYDMAKQAAYEVYEETGISPKDVKVCELHDCFTTNELISYEALGLADEGEAEKFVVDEQNTYGG